MEEHCMHIIWLLSLYCIFSYHESVCWVIRTIHFQYGEFLAQILCGSQTRAFSVIYITIFIHKIIVYNFWNSWIKDDIKHKFMEQCIWFTTVKLTTAMNFMWPTIWTVWHLTIQYSLWCFHSINHLIVVTSPNISND